MRNPLTLAVAALLLLATSVSAAPAAAPTNVVARAAYDQAHTTNVLEHEPMLPSLRSSEWFARVSAEAAYWRRRVAGGKPKAAAAAGRARPGRGEVPVRMGTGRVVTKAREEARDKTGKKIALKKGPDGEVIWRSRPAGVEALAAVVKSGDRWGWVQSGGRGMDAMLHWMHGLAPTPHEAEGSGSAV